MTSKVTSELPLGAQQSCITILAGFFWRLIFVTETNGENKSCGKRFEPLAQKKLAKNIERLKSSDDFS